MLSPPDSRAPDGVFVTPRALKLKVSTIGKLGLTVGAGQVPGLTLSFKLPTLLRKLEQLSPQVDKSPLMSIPFQFCR